MAMAICLQMDPLAVKVGLRMANGMAMGYAFSDCNVYDGQWENGHPNGFARLPMIMVKNIEDTFQMEYFIMVMEP